MAQSVEGLALDVESQEYGKATREYQKVLAHQVVKLTAKGDAARSTKAQEGGPGSAAGRN